MATSSHSVARSIAHSVAERGLIYALWVVVALIAGGARVVAQDTVPGTMTTPQTVMLTSEDIDRFIAAVTELSPLGLHLASSIGGDPTGITQMTAAMQANADALAILGKHGFDPTGFQQVGYSIMMAYAAGQVRGADAEIAAIRGHLASLKGQIPDAQYREIERQMLGMQRELAKQPEENIALVQANQSRIAAATN